MSGLLGDYAKGLLGFVSDPQSWKDMGRNAVGLLGAPLPTKDEAMANLQRMRFRGSVMRDYPGPETDLAKSHSEKMMNLALGMNPILQTVYHGSPHKFNAFDMKKIGTGEGAQAYGHGLYFAESPDVAKSYAPRNAKYEGNLLKRYEQAQAAQDYTRAGVLEDALLHNSPTQMRQRFTVENGYEPAQVAKFHEIIAKEIEPLYKKHNVGLYKVDLPDDQIAKMLDWDKPLSQQAPEIRAAFKDKISSSVERVADDGSGYTFRARVGNSFGYGKTPEEAASKISADSIKGAALYDLLGDQVAASKYLQSLGIPGIRYLDGGSRGAGQGTSNFVVFDDKIPKILGRE